MDNKIIMIPSELLQHHPSNPRIGLGDLTELAESIKVRGIMQNLTVVKSPVDTDKYWVVIGNRRLEAGKLAGLECFPCAVAELDVKDQMATMLMENMQRNDLTIAEQVGGIQMMMDLGESVKTIAAKTGLSETSIRKRAALATLPKNDMCIAVDKGATLLDLMNIMELEDPDEQQKVLKSFGTNNWNYTLNDAKSRQAQKAFRAKILPMIEGISPFKNSNDAYNGKYKLVISWNRNNKDEPKPPKLEEGKQYHYLDTGWSISLYVRNDEYMQQQENAKQSKRRLKALKEKGQALNRQAFELRSIFVRNYRCNDAGRKILWAKLFEFIVSERGYSGNADLIGYHDWSTGDIREMLAIPLEQDRVKEETFQEELKRRGVSKESFLLAWALNGGICEKRIQYGYCNDYDGGYRQDEKLDKQYDLLMALGYEMSDFEKSLRDGTHPFFANPEVEV